MNKFFYLHLSWQKQEFVGLVPASELNRYWLQTPNRPLLNQPFLQQVALHNWLAELLPILTTTWPGCQLLAINDEEALVENQLAQEFEFKLSESGLVRLQFYANDELLSRLTQAQAQHQLQLPQANNEAATLAFKDKAGNALNLSIVDYWQATLTPIAVMQLELRIGYQQLVVYLPLHLLNYLSELYLPQLPKGALSSYAYQWLVAKLAASWPATPELTWQIVGISSGRLPRLPLSQLEFAHANFSSPVWVETASAQPLFELIQRYGGVNSSVPLLASQQKLSFPVIRQEFSLTPSQLQQLKVGDVILGNQSSNSRQVAIKLGKMSLQAELVNEQTLIIKGRA